MKESKGHDFVIRPRDATQLMHGANTEIYMDGQKLGGVVSFKLDLQPRQIARITLEFFGRVDIEGRFEAVDPVLRTLGNNNSRLGTYQPVGTAPTPFVEAPSEVEVDDPEFSF